MRRGSVYLLPLARLWVTHSIWQFARSVATYTTLPSLTTHIRQYALPATVSASAYVPIWAGGTGVMGRDFTI